MRIKVTGRQPLRGAYQVSGNSNAAMALVAASMLSGASVQLANMPDTVSVGVMLEIGTGLGLRVDEGTPGDGRITLHTPHITGRGLSREHGDALSGTLLLLAPILARRRHARLTTDQSISRLSAHLAALRDLTFQAAAPH